MAVTEPKEVPSKADSTHTEIVDKTEKEDIQIGESIESVSLQRRMYPRQVQFFAIGGSIGTALFITIGYGLLHGGAGSLFIAFVLHAGVMCLVNGSLAEMTTFMPVSTAFVQHAYNWVDNAWGFMAGWNFFLFEALLIPFEITAVDLILTFWRDDIPSAAVITAIIVFYAITNVLAVGYFGEAEFWLSCGKLLLIILLYTFTFVTMCGGNPQRQAYGFSNWSKPGPFVEYFSTGDLGRFQGFLAALWQAAFITVGPEYLGACAGEVQHPRKTLRRAFKQVYWRFLLFFILGAVCVGIIIPANDPTLVRILGAGETGNGGSSPFVIAMTNMGVEGLPHLINGLLLTSVYSAGNCYVYTTGRCLYGLAANGQAPKIFMKTTKNGVPIYSLAVSIAFACLAYLKLSSGTVQVLTWLTNLITGGTLVTYIAMCVNYIFFYRALKAQGYDRDSLPFKSWFQPYGAWFALIWMFLIELFYGYAVFLKGNWDVGSFFSSYTMAFIALCTFSGYKVIMRTKFVKPEDADLVWERPLIDQHEQTFIIREDPLWTSVRKFLRVDKLLLKTRSNKSEA